MAGAQIECPHCHEAQPRSNIVCDFCGKRLPEIETPEKKEAAERLAAEQELLARQQRMREQRITWMFGGVAVLFLIFLLPRGCGMFHRSHASAVSIEDTRITDYEAGGEKTKIVQF